jgi:predicted TIM-barrel fold metal-dependent hydrolase
MSDLETARRAFLASDDEALLPIVDAHHHFWDVAHNPHPWLQQKTRIPFRYGDYGAICRDYLPVDHARAAAGHRVLRSVAMEGEWDSADPVGEARWIESLAGRCGVPHAFAAQIWLDRDDVAGVLAAYASMPLVRSVRHKPRCTSRAEHREDWSEPGSMRCPRWRDGYARLRDANLMFELQVPWWHLDEAVELARDFSATMIVLNHAGLPAERDAASLALWRRAIDRVAEEPNVVVKLSGLGVPGRAWTADLQRPVVDALLASFGPARCMVASNFPVDGLVANLDDIFQGFKTLSRHLPRQERLALFCDNACRLYGLA